MKELIKARLIPEGDVDNRSITDIDAKELVSYRRIHLFAGIAGWARALQLAGCPEDLRIITGSCPCQSFSSAGKRKGFEDHRDLWPHMSRIVRELRIPVVVGEQVPGAIAHGWWDRICTELEEADYACGACVLPACSVGAPHIRSRLFWAGVRRLGNADSQQAHPAIEGQSMPCAGLPVGRVALPNGNGWEQRRPECAGQGREPEPSPVDGGAACGVADAEDPNRWRSGAEDDSRRRTQEAGGCGDSVRRLGDVQQQGLEGHSGDALDRDEPGRIGAGAAGSTPATGHWSDALPILCRDGKTRRIPAPQSGIFGLVAGLPEGMDLGWIESAFPLAGKIEGRVGLLKGYGNAIVPQVAAAFLRAVLQ